MPFVPLEQRIERGFGGAADVAGTILMAIGLGRLITARPPVAAEPPTATARVAAVEVSATPAVAIESNLINPATGRPFNAPPQPPQIYLGTSDVPLNAARPPLVFDTQLVLPPEPVVINGSTGLPIGVELPPLIGSETPPLVIAQTVPRHAPAVQPRLGIVANSEIPAVPRPPIANGPPTVPATSAARIARLTQELSALEARRRLAAPQDLLEVHREIVRVNTELSRLIRSPEVAAPQTPRLGTLQSVGHEAWESSGGLRYVGRDPQGLTRVQHVMRHAADDAARAGRHGVFDAGRAGALGVVDEAWAMAQLRGPNVTVVTQGNRTVYTVDMGRRVGYVGGQAGAAAGNPAANHIQIVVQGGPLPPGVFGPPAPPQVITAFPVIP